MLHHDEDAVRVRLRLERRGVRKVDTTLRIDVDRPFVVGVGGQGRVLRLVYQR